MSRGSIFEIYDLAYDPYQQVTLDISVYVYSL